MFKNKIFFLFFFLTTYTVFSQNIIGRDTIHNQKEVIQLDWIPTYDEALERSKIEKNQCLFISQDLIGVVLASFWIKNCFIQKSLRNCLTKRYFCKK